MAQTTGSLTGALGKIEISFDDGSTWTDISGSTTSMDQVEYARSSGSKNTFGDAFAVVTVGKQLPTNIVVNALYTETTSEATDKAITGIKANTPCDLRWQYADVTTLADRTQKRIPTVRDPIDITLPLFDDPSLSWYSTVQTASETATVTGVRIVFPNNSRLLANGYWSLQKTPTVSDSTLRGEISISLSAEPTRYAT